MAACAGTVPRARHHAREVLWDAGLKELIESAELVVSEIVTNAVRAASGLDPERPAAAPRPVIRLWLAPGQDNVLVMVWDHSPLLPERQMPGPDADRGRGLFLVEMLSAQWGAFGLGDKAGKVVWARCVS
jgi:anti-sigma regulatory factor (Ser/Thr protein kinase)